MFELNLFEVHFQLFRDQHRNGRIGALAHFHVGHGQHDLPVATDANEGVGREATGAGRFRCIICEWQMQAEHQAATRGCAGLKKSAPGEGIRRR
jgi:hypothetical protein